MLAGGSSQAAEVTYRFAGRLSDKWGTLPAGTPFSGYFKYTYPQKAHGYGGAGAWYNFTKLSLTVGRQTVLIDRGYRFLGQSVFFQGGRGTSTFGITADDPNWRMNRPKLGGIPVGIGLWVTDYHQLARGGGSLAVLKNRNLVGSGLKLEMFNSTRLIINDIRKNGVNIQSPLTYFSGSMARR
jgi:hypothetical protein